MLLEVLRDLQDIWANYEDGRVYGSLEYKNDCIGAEILERINKNSEKKIEVAEGFYIAVFDVEKIDRVDMDAEKDGIMKAVHLNEVLDDYLADGHKYACSGIDGMTFAPLPGDVRGKKYLYVAYGVYGDINRNDNDHQVILRYDISDWGKYEKSLNQSDMHKEGPEKPDSKYFVYTGNTEYGIQNLEYDAYTGCLFAAVYVGHKECFPNYPMFVIDLNKRAEVAELENLNETGEVLALADIGLCDEKTCIHGIDFPYGSTGMISLGDGYFYFSRHFVEDNKWGTSIGLYKFDGKAGFVEIE